MRNEGRLYIIYIYIGEEIFKALLKEKERKKRKKGEKKSEERNNN